MINEIAMWLKGASGSKPAKTIPFEGFDRIPFERLHLRGKSSALGQALMEVCLARVKSISDIDLLLTDDVCFRIDPFANPDLLRQFFASRLTNAFFSMSMFDLYDAIEYRAIYYSKLFSSATLTIALRAKPKLLVLGNKPDAICTLCAKKESPGFYTGCLLNDGEPVPECEYTCDGNGNLFLKK